MKPFFVSERDLISVGDVKQFAYCPRIPYFTRFLGLKPPSTYLMRKGSADEMAFGQKQKRHTLSRFGFETATKHRCVTLLSKKFGLTGIIDLVVEGPCELIVVDFKSAENTKPENHILQLTAYSLLAEENFKKPCRRGFLFYSREEEWVEVKITDVLRKKTLSMILEINSIIVSGAFPEATAFIEKCKNCEFLNFCGDRW